MCDNKPIVHCLDGNTAVAMNAYRCIDTAYLFPITPSSDCTANIEAFSGEKRKNFYGDVVSCIQGASELNASAGVHGSSVAGALSATFTSSQGFLLMAANLYHLANLKIPAVIHLASRSLDTNQTCIQEDHSDLMFMEGSNMSCLSAGNVQEAHDMALLAHACAIEAHGAFVHSYEGFRVSHQFETFEEVPFEIGKQMINMDKVRAYRYNEAVDPSRPDGRNIVAAGDIAATLYESLAPHFKAIPDVVEKVFNKFKSLTGREYHPFEYYGHPEAEHVIVIMGCAGLTAVNVIDSLNKDPNNKFGVIRVRLWRPFSMDYFTRVLPKTCKTIAVCDRVRDHCAVSEPLYEDVVSALIKTDRYGPDGVQFVSNGRYGLVGRDLKPIDVCAILNMLKTSLADKSKRRYEFNVCVIDDIYHTHLEHTPDVISMLPEQILPEGTAEAALWGIGADGTVGAAKNAIKILSDDRPEIYAQANFVFDGKKSGGVTRTFLRFGPSKITAQFNPENADYVACHTQSYVGRYNFIKPAKKNAVFVLNTEHEGIEAIEAFLPASLKRAIAKKNIRFYAVDASKVAIASGLPGNRTNSILILFFLRFGLGSLLNFDKAIEGFKNLVRKTYVKQGQAVIDSNIRAIENTVNIIDSCEVKYDHDKWANDNSKDSESLAGKLASIEHYPFDDLMKHDGIYGRINRLEYDDITTSEVERFNNGVFPAGYGVYEKQGSAVKVPTWNSSTCIQCNQCALACPHAVIRPFLVDEDDNIIEELGGKTVDIKAKKLAEGAKAKYILSVSPLDCRGCEVCTVACPTNSLSMIPLSEAEPTQKTFNYLDQNYREAGNFIDPLKCTPNELAYRNPYFFSPGSCPGCAESAHVKLLTAMFGESMVIPVGIGCFTVWSHNNYIRPYIPDKNGRGIAAACATFEDNAPYGLGMVFGTRHLRNRLRRIISEGVEKLDQDSDFAKMLRGWLENYDDAKLSLKFADEIQAEIGVRRVSLGTNLTPKYELPAHFGNQFMDEIGSLSQYLAKRTHWIIAGDGAFYDIDFQGVDHVVSQQRNIDLNILVLVNQVYANTGAQLVKSTSIGAICKDASTGVTNECKKMSTMFLTSYPGSYVAHVSLGANRTQCIKAFREAVAYKGVSIVFAYCPCIAHSITGGMKNSEQQQKLVVDCGAWPLFRYNPDAESGKRLVIDSKITRKTSEWTANEGRFLMTPKKNPERAEEFAKRLQADADNHYALLNSLSL